MAEKVRTVRVEEFDEFMRFLERCFGHSWNFFPRQYPHLYRPDAESCSWAYVIERDGKIVSHVGVYPIHAVCLGARIPIGGIGAVATLPSERGKGYMSRLLRHCIGEMREKGYLVSGLGGDRQRYGTFGWERAGLAYRVSFSRRSLDWANVEPIPVEQKAPVDAASTVEQFHSKVACYTERPRLRQQLQKREIRAWVTDDGYALVSGEDRGNLSIMEFVSASGNEPGLIRGLMEWVGAGGAHCTLSAWDTERLGRLMPYVSGWSSGCDWTYRIIDLPGLLQACNSILESRAAGLANFDVTIGIREHDRTDMATIAVENGKVNVTAGHDSKNYVELNPVEAARLVLGGPPVKDQEKLPPGLVKLFPVPVHVPALDHV